MPAELLNGIDWVLFDAVGTLIYPDPPVADAYHAVARRHGSRLSVRQIAQRFAAAFHEHMTDKAATNEGVERQRWQQIVTQTIDDVPASAEAIFNDLWSHFAAAEHWRVFDDVPPVLSELRQRGFRLGIASNFDRRLHQILAGHRELAAFDAFFVSSELGYSKPQREFFESAGQQLKVSRASIALVGDDETNDVAGAMAAGWRAIWLCRGGASERADASCAAIQSLLDLL